MPLASPSRDYLRRRQIAESLKGELRLRYASAVHAAAGEAAETFLARSRSFWPEYEEVNRVWLPEDPVYTGSRMGVALTTTADFWTLSSPAAGQARVLESYVAGEAIASTVLRIAVQRSTGGATPVNQTPEKANSRSPAAASTFATSWTTQPTLSGQPAITQTFNAYGGLDRWVALPGHEIYLVNGEILSSRSAAGTPTVSGHVIWEEL